MNVLVACERSGIVRDAFIARGHNAMSCDLEETENPGFHYKGDVLDVLYWPWDMVIAFVPCTHLATSGARWFKDKVEDGRQKAAIDFFLLFTRLDCPRVAIENPVGIMSTHYRKPDQIIHPHMFYHPEQKMTCLWLKGLPPLMAMCQEVGYIDHRIHRRISKKDRAIVRSRTYSGIALAMSEQWG